MKIAAITVCCLVLSGIALSSVKVVPFVPQECADHVQFSVVLAGKPLSGARLDLYRGFNVDTTRTQPLFSVVSDDAGVALSRRLMPGDYMVYARYEEVRSMIFNESARTFLYLRVRRESETSRISVDFTDAVQQVKKADEDFGKQVEEASEAVTPDRITSFRGIVVDPSGAHVPSVKVSVAQRVSGVWITPLQTVSGTNGQFAGQLKDGRYIALFRASGFQSAIVPFEINAAGSRDLKVILQVGRAVQ